MISSAVTIPADVSPTSEEQKSNSTDDNTLKRKYSGSQNQTNKRLHVQPTGDALDYDDAPRTNTNIPTGPSLRRPSSPETRPPKANFAEDKKRNQRLFGGILGVVSQKTASTTSAHRKRDEIEARARERQRKEHEEQEAERARRKETIRRKRDVQQQTWAREAQARKHENMRHMAGFLLTKTRPRLYYKPWELLPGDEETLQRQRDDVEKQIKREQGLRFDSGSRKNISPKRSSVEGSALDAQADHVEARVDKKFVEEARLHEPEAQAGEGPQPNVDANSSPKADVQQLEKADLDMQDDDNHAGELVEGQEDDVIY